MRDWFNSRHGFRDNTLFPLFPPYEYFRFECRCINIIEILGVYFSSFYNYYIVYELKLAGLSPSRGITSANIWLVRVSIGLIKVKKKNKNGTIKIHFWVFRSKILCPSLFFTFSKNFYFSTTTFSWNFNVIKYLFNSIIYILA